MLFCDLDGVLADFRARYEALFGTCPAERLCDAGWAKVRSAKGFYATMPMMADARELWDYIAGRSPTILTGLPRSVPQAEADKRRWVAELLGEGVLVICCRAADKHLHAKAGDILIDNSKNLRRRWHQGGWHLRPSPLGCGDDCSASEARPVGDTHSARPVVSERERVCAQRLPTITPLWPPVAE